MKNFTFFLQILRPTQWIKNAFIFAPLFFSYSFYNPQSWLLTVKAALCFLFFSSATYIANDIKDINEDRSHPSKKFRPLASKKLALSSAINLFLILLILGFITLYFLPIACFGVVVFYLILQIAYNYGLKQQAILDVMIIALGFVLRILMGCFAINAPVSPWIIVTTYFLALFLGFGKRYSELSVAKYGENRISLKFYDKNLLQIFIAISCACAVLSYALYTIEAARLFGKTNLVYTVVFVIFGLFRYMQVLFFDQEISSPEKIIFKHKIFLINGALWFITTMMVLV